MPPSRLPRRACLCLGALGLLGGCERAAAPRLYQTLAGWVVARHAGTGELLVRVGGSGPAREQTVFCVVTKDSEIYVNDMFTTIEAVRIGDAIEVVGYPDPDPRQERFVVSCARIERDLPAPPIPDLPPPSTAPATQPAEK